MSITSRAKNTKQKNPHTKRRHDLAGYQHIIPSKGVSQRPAVLGVRARKRAIAKHAAKVADMQRQS